MLTRREVVRGVAGAATLGGMSRRSLAATVQRISMERFAKIPARVEQFQKLFTEMRKKKASEPGSFFFQGAVHWFPNLSGAAVAASPDLKVLADMFNSDPDAKKVMSYWNQCTHLAAPTAGAGIGPAKSPGDFLLWHRAFLYYFEQHARKTLNDSTFTIPYWNYGGAAATRAIPAIFIDAKLGAENNPLYPIGGRVRTLKTGTDQLADWRVDTTAVMANEYYFSEPGIEGMGDDLGFGTSMDSAPHGLVHSGIGGWMGSVETAAFDPVFWVHHANIDRLFNQWLGKRRYWSRSMTKQDVATWLAATPYAFFTADGKLESKPRSFFLDTKNLGYSYDSDPSVIMLPVLPPSNVPPAVLASNHTMAVPKGVTHFVEKSAGVLQQPLQVSPNAPTSLQIPLALPAGSAPMSGKVPLAITNQTSNKDNRTYLVLDGVKKAGEKGGTYEVYIGPQAADAKGATSPAFAGRFTSFDVPPSDIPGTGKTFRFNITEHLGKLGTQILQNLSVRIVPVSDTAEAAAETKPGSLVIQKMEIRSASPSTLPIK